MPSQQHTRGGAGHVAACDERTRQLPTATANAASPTLCMQHLRSPRQSPHPHVQSKRRAEETPRALTARGPMCIGLCMCWPRALAALLRVSALSTPQTGVKDMRCVQRTQVQGRAHCAVTHAPTSSLSPAGVPWCCARSVIAAVAASIKRQTCVTAISSRHTSRQPALFWYGCSSGRAHRAQALLTPPWVPCQGAAGSLLGAAAPSGCQGRR
jgi:hypothetical protein